MSAPLSGNTIFDDPIFGGLLALSSAVPDDLISAGVSALSSAIPDDLISAEVSALSSAIPDNLISAGVPALLSTIPDDLISTRVSDPFSRTINSDSPEMTRKNRAIRPIERWVSVKLFSNRVFRVVYHRTYKIDNNTF